MHTAIDEIAPDIFRLSTWVEDVAPPAGFTFNQFLVRAEQPFLFHTGMRGLFPLVSEAVGKLVPIEQLRWISFAHVEADECGAMNLFLAAAPQAEVVHGALACMVSLDDLADRPPAVAGETALDIGGKRMRFLPTPHVPHNWESGLWFEETTRTLLAGDLFTHIGNGMPLTTDDIVEPAMLGESVFHSTSLGPNVAPTLRNLAQLEPETLALMHGSSYRGDGRAALEQLADAYESQVAAFATA